MRKWRYIVPVVGGCLPLAAAGQGAAEKPASRPNVLLIYADDVGFGDLSCNGYGSVPMSNGWRARESASPTLTAPLRPALRRATLC